MPHASYHLPRRELVNSHPLLASHMRPVKDHNEPEVEFGDGMGECQEKDYN
jgi:hypothetical protein